MFGWHRGSTAETLEEDVPSEAAPYELAAIGLLTDDGRYVGWVSTEGERTSDWLNQHDALPIHGLAPEGEVPVDQPPALPSGPPETIERSSVIWAVPPPLPPNRHLRLHRRRMLVHLELDEWEISGQLHVRPGADAADQLLRGSRLMVPLTEVQVSSREDPTQTGSLPVLVVNRTRVRRIIAEQPHRSAPVPPPVETAKPAPDPAPATASVAGEAPAPTIEGAPIETGADLVQSALMVLLEAEVIDVSEFQSIRARVVAGNGTSAQPK